MCSIYVSGVPSNRPILPLNLTILLGKGWHFWFLIFFLLARVDGHSPPLKRCLPSKEMPVVGPCFQPNFLWWKQDFVSLQNVMLQAIGPAFKKIRRRLATSETQHTWRGLRSHTRPLAAWQICFWLSDQDMVIYGAPAATFLVRYVLCWIPVSLFARC